MEENQARGSVYGLCGSLSGGPSLFHEDVTLRPDRALLDLCALCKHGKGGNISILGTMEKAQGRFKTFLLLTLENMKSSKSHPLKGKKKVQTASRMFLFNLPQIASKINNCEYLLYLEGCG